MRSPTRIVLLFAVAGLLLVSRRARPDVPPDIAEIQNKLAHHQGLTDDEQRRLFEWTMRKSNQTENDIGQTPTEDQNVGMPKDLQEIIARAQATGQMSAADRQRLKDWAANMKKNKGALLHDARDTGKLLQQSVPPDASHMPHDTANPADNTITVDIKQRGSGKNGAWETTGSLTVPVSITVDDNANEKAFHLKFRPNPVGSYQAQLHSSGWDLTSDGKDSAGKRCSEHRDTFDVVVSGAGSSRDSRVWLAGEVVTPAGRRPYTNAQLTVVLTAQNQITCACNSANDKQLVQPAVLMPVTLDGLRGDVPFNQGMGDLPAVAPGQRLMDRGDPAFKNTLEQAFFNFDTAGARRTVDEGGDFVTSSTYHYKMPAKDGAVVDSTVTFRFKLKFPERVCGPDITEPLKRTMEKLRKNFNALPDETKNRACLAAASPASYVDWDINGIHDRHEWIDATHPTCDVGGPNPTVEVDKQCFYTGSVNYVLWGVMFRLCADRHPGDPGFFTEDNAVAYISAYKGGVPGVIKSSGNWGPSQWWAKAGYEGWPAAATPFGDRPKQKCKCPKSMGQDFPSNDGHSTFLVGWFPAFNKELNAPLP